MDKHIGHVLVTGAGVSGIRAALDLAETGYQVTLTESSPAIGGILAKLDYQFPTDHCGMCRMLPFVGRDDASQHCMRRSLFHRNIDIRPDTGVVRCEGGPGAFQITLRREPRLIDTERCIGCGDCVAACPVELPDRFNEGLTTRKAIYRPVPHNLPNLYAIDRDACTRCGECLPVCPVEAIDLEASESEETLEVGAVVLASGCSLYDPAKGQDFLSYAASPNVVTSLELERMLSGSGTFRGRLTRPSDGQPARRVAWLQCVGSRNRARGRDYCSSICCMFALKEAVLARELGGPEVEATLFYMDLRTFGKEYHRYRTEAEDQHGVRTVRCRAHCVMVRDDGTPSIRYFGADGQPHEEDFDLVVLATGQAPPSEMASFREIFGLEADSQGFLKTDPTRQVRTSKPGIFACGSLTGLRDISESLLQGGAAAADASSMLIDAGHDRKRLEAPTERRNVDRELPRTLILLGPWPHQAQRGRLDMATLARRAALLPSVAEVRLLERPISFSLDEVRQLLESSDANRVLLAATLPQIFGPRLRELAARNGYTPSLVDAIDFYGPMRRVLDLSNGTDIMAEALTLLRAAVAELSVRDPIRPATHPIEQRALVIGGGISGMECALTLARQGVEVALVEKSPHLGGHATQLRYLPEGFDPRALAQDMAHQVEGEQRITLFTDAEVIETRGSVGRFWSRVRTGLKEQVVLHGATIVAIGGGEAPARGEHGIDQSDAVVTQEQLEQGLADGTVDASRLETVVMIQCVGSRQKGKREYCSRLCCGSALKNAAKLLELNPEARVIVLYRDLMAYGFKERLYTEARNKGVIFATYSPERQPTVELGDRSPRVTFHDEVLQDDLRVKADLVVLSTGVQPADGAALARALGVELDDHGFFSEVDHKWRPVETLREGVLACGLAHSPRSIPEALVMAQATAQRALAVLVHPEITASQVTSKVRRVLCATCELCVTLCPYQARSLDPSEGEIVVDELTCQGCGICVAACPSGAASLQGRTVKQVMAELDGFLAGVV